MDNIPSTEPVEFMLNVGPQHPATHGVLRLLINVDGERISQVETHIGYLHRGTEKLCEGETFSQIISLFDRLDYVSNFNMEMSYVMAVEKILGLNVPIRAEYIRVITCELNRIASHLLFYGTLGLDIGAMTPVMYAFREREALQAYFESVSGARMMHNFFRVGGVKEDLPEGFLDSLTSYLPKLKQAVQECDQLLTLNDIFLERTKGVGVLEKDAAVDFAVSGPNLRASGVEHDIRRTEPYSIYPNLKFRIPTGTNGDSWDRYWVRMQEIHESIVIIEQCIEQIEPGPISGRTRTVIRPPKGEAYVRTESPRGDFGVYLVTEENKEQPYRIKMRSPSFCSLMALETMLQGEYLADAVTILGTLDFIMGEVDR